MAANSAQTLECASPTICLVFLSPVLRLRLLLVNSIKQHLACKLVLSKKLLEARTGDKVVEDQAMAALPPAVKENSLHFVNNPLEVPQSFRLTLIKSNSLPLSLSITSLQP